jgi:hypothetical protein
MPERHATRAGNACFAVSLVVSHAGFFVDMTSMTF